MLVRLDPIVIVPYDEAWPDLFRRERAVIEAALASVLVRPVEHIGSTAVPGLAAKPIIDMCAVVGSVEAVDVEAPKLHAAGWLAAPEPGDAAERRRSYCTPTIERRTHPLHVVEEDSAGWRGWLAFRDHLRANAEVAAAYGRLKESLAERSTGPEDRAGYRLGKAPFIQDITEKAT